MSEKFPKDFIRVITKRLLYGNYSQSSPILLLSKIFYLWTYDKEVLIGPI